MSIVVIRRVRPPVRPATSDQQIFLLKRFTQHFFMYRFKIYILKLVIAAKMGYTMKTLKLIKFKMADLRPLSTLICVITGKPCQIARPYYWTKCAVFVLHAANNQFSDNFNNGGKLLLSVLLFQMIFTFKRWLEAEAYFCRRLALFYLPKSVITFKRWEKPIALLLTLML